MIPVRGLGQPVGTPPSPWVIFGALALIGWLIGGVGIATSVGKRS